MELKAKYQYTHFIYPFVVEDKKYVNFINSLLAKNRQWKMSIREHKNNEELYNFYLPYMRRFLFPTLFWSNDYRKQFKGMNLIKKSYIVSKLSCVTFEYNLSNIKTGTVKEKRIGEIDFDISKISLICFEPGICFLDIKTELEYDDDYIDFNKILDFNHYFRNLTPRAVSSYASNAILKAKNIDKVENIAKFIKSVISEYETNDLEKIYYDKMFTYSYVCVDNWKQEKDFENMKNEFYKYQYVMESKSTAIFNKDFEKLKDNCYSRWQFSQFGFSKESGVVLVSDKEKYDITKMPYMYEKTYLYMLLLAFYQRISLINFSQDLLKEDKTKIKSLKQRFNRFTNFSWFSQITNSEHGMDIWRKWQQAFELPALFEEVRKEYMEYYDFVVVNGQERINQILLIIYVVSVTLSGLTMLMQYYNLKSIAWLEPVVLGLILVCVLSYPIYLCISYLKHKIESRK